MAFASLTVLAGCPGPLRGGDTGTGNTGGPTAGTTGGSGTTGAAGANGGTSGGAGKGGAGAAVSGSSGSSGPGAGGSATGAAGVGAGGGGTGNTSGSAGSGVAGTGTGTAGATGGSAGGAKGGSGGTTPPRGPTPAMNGINFPFPQNRESSPRCVYPANYLNADVTAAYAQWKTDLVTTNGAGGARRVQRTSTDGVSMYTPAGSTVSEGIGYGMLIAVFMGGKDDQMLFDDLWNYSQKHKDANGLMNWAITADGSMTPGEGGATDADEDIAFALLMADKQWGSAGTLNYLSLAKAQISAIWLHEVVDSKLAGPGDSWGTTNLWNNINISYFAPAYYRLFKTVDDPSHAWDAVITTVYDTILSPNNTLDKGALKPANKNTSNGLVPAWCTSSGDMSMTTPFNYQYDSCRTPFRIALDWCWFGEPRAQMYLAKTSAFFSGIGAANIVDGYNLDGTPKPEHTTGQSAAFVGPAGVGAMSSATYQSFVTDAYGRVATRQLMVGGAYYEESWTMLSLLMMTGNFLDYTSIQPAH
ncbi:MAG TPA: glycosyl hydrolase family 8 [Polyangia bacterium]